MKNKNILYFIVIILSSVFSINVTGQMVRPFLAHEVVETGNGQKIEILRCRGDGPAEECDCIYYTDKRQNGKRMWQNAETIREAQRAGQLEVTAAREQANREAALAAAEKAKKAASLKAAREKDTTVSNETNSVIRTIRKQNEDIKTNGFVKANSLRGRNSSNQNNQPVITKPASPSLNEIVRHADSLSNASKPDKNETLAVVPDSTEMDQVYIPSSGVKQIYQKEAPKPEPVKVNTEPAIAEKNKENAAQKPIIIIDTAAIMDFTTLRKMDEQNGNVAVDPIVPAPKQKATVNINDTVKQETEFVTPTLINEQEPAPKPKKNIGKVENDKLINVVENADSVVRNEGNKIDTAVIKTDVKTEETKPLINPVTDSVNNEPVHSNIDPVATETSVDSLKTVMKDEMIKVDTAVSIPLAEPVLKKVKKEKKVKVKVKEEHEATIPVISPSPVSSPVSEEMLTPLQKAAQMADSLRKANEKADSTADENYKKPTQVPDSTAPAPPRDINMNAPVLPEKTKPVENTTTQNDEIKVENNYSGAVNDVSKEAALNNSLDKKKLHYQTKPIN